MTFLPPRPTCAFGAYCSTLTLLVVIGVLIVSGLPAQSQHRPGVSPAPRAEVTEATTESVGPNGRYHLTWRTTPEVPVSVYVSGHPSAAPDQMLRLATAIDETDYEATVPDSIARPYFLIQPDGKGTGRRTATRVLPLDGGRNFRDLGGYAAANGKRVKWGRIFRSGVLANLTDADYDYLADLGIEVICDFRSSEERTNETTNWRGGSAPKIISWGYSNSRGESERLFQGDLTAEKMRGVMIELYTKIAYEHADKYATMFRHLADGRTPLLFHCSAGKDRAGTGAALLLTALGVDRKTVIQDYAMSDDVVDYEEAFSEELRKAREQGGLMAALAELPSEVRAPLFRSDPAYIKSMFAELEANHGSVDGFIKTEMDIDEETLDRMRTRLLE